MKSIRRYGLAAWLTAIFLLTGCGGGGSPAGGPQTTGRVGVHVSWPGRGRYIPPYANSVVFQLTVTGGPSYTLTLNRTGDSASEGSAVFPQQIPTGNQTLTATAYTQTNGLGDAVGTATTTVAVVGGQTATTDVTGDIQSTIDHLVIDGQPLTVSTTSTLTVTGHAVDGGGHVMLLAQGALAWDVTAGSSYGSINSVTGLFTPISAGTATIRLREVGAGKSVSAGVTVTSPPAGGQLTVAVDWPGRSRYVPPYANSLVCVLTISPSESHSLTINRVGNSGATGSATFPQGFSTGTYSLAVTAMSAADGGGSAVASATVNVSISAGSTTTKNVSGDLTSTIDHLVIDGQPLTVAAPNALTIQGHAETAANATILLPQGALTWDVTAGGTYGSINATTGVFTASSAGTATVRLREVGASKSVTAQVTVTGAPAPQKFYISDSGNSRLVRFDSISGTNWTTMAAGSNWISPPVVDSSGRVYWTDLVNNQVCRADSFGGSVVTFGSTGSGTGQFDGPAGIAVDSQNRIYIADQYNNRVVRIDDMNGTNWTEVGGFGTDDGQLYLPQGIVVASNGDTYVADTGNCRIVKFTNMASSGWTTYGGTRGSDVGQFDTPVALAVTSSGIYVADSMNNRIAFIADMTGTGWATLGGPDAGSGSGAFDGTTGVAVDGNGLIYVTDRNNNRVVRVNNMAGAGWTTFGTSGAGANQFAGPAGICIR